MKGSNVSSILKSPPLTISTQLPTERNTGCVTITSADSVAFGVVLPEGHTYARYVLRIVYKNLSGRRITINRCDAPIQWVPISSEEIMIQIEILDSKRLLMFPIETNSAVSDELWFLDLSKPLMFNHSITAMMQSNNDTEKFHFTTVPYQYRAPPVSPSSSFSSSASTEIPILHHNNPHHSGSSGYRSATVSMSRSSECSDDQQRQVLTPSAVSYLLLLTSSACYKCTTPEPRSTPPSDEGTPPNVRHGTAATATASRFYGRDSTLSTSLSPQPEPNKMSTSNKSQSSNAMPIPNIRHSATQQQQWPHEGHFYNQIDFPPTIQFHRSHSDESPRMETQSMFEPSPEPKMSNSQQSESDYYSYAVPTHHTSFALQKSLGPPKSLPEVNDHSLYVPMERKQLKLPKISTSDELYEEPNYNSGTDGSATCDAYNLCYERFSHHSRQPNEPTVQTYVNLQAAHANLQSSAANLQSSAAAHGNLQSSAAAHANLQSSAATRVSLQPPVANLQSSAATRVSLQPPVANLQPTTHENFQPPTTHENFQLPTTHENFQPQTFRRQTSAEHTSCGNRQSSSESTYRERVGSCIIPTPLYTAQQQPPSSRKWFRRLMFKTKV